MVFDSHTICYQHLCPNIILSHHDQNVIVKRAHHHELSIKHVQNSTRCDMQMLVIFVTVLHKETRNSFVLFLNKHFSIFQIRQINENKLYFL